MDQSAVEKRIRDLLAGEPQPGRSHEMRVELSGLKVQFEIRVENVVVELGGADEGAE